MSEPQAAASRAATTRFYFAVWRWHFYAGLVVVPFLAMLAVTGIVIVWFTAVSPEYGDRLAVSPGPAALAPSAQVAAALAAHPGGVAGQYVTPYDAATPALVRVDLDAGARMVAVDPYTGAVLRDRPQAGTWNEFATNVHGELLIGGNGGVGDFLVEIAASLGILLLVTGLYLAWPRGDRRLRHLLVPDLRARGRAFWKQLHLVLGVWLSVVLLFFLISGLSWAGVWGGKFVQAWSTFPAEKWDAVPLSDATHASMNHTAAETVPWAIEQTPMPASGSAAGVAGVPAGTPVDIDAIVALGRVLGFGARVQVAYPAGETGVWTLSRDSMSYDSPDPTADRTVHVDRYTGKVLADVGYADYSVGGKAMAVGIALHEGQLGLWNVIANFAICAAILLLVASGVVTWWKRRPSGSFRLGAPPETAEVPVGRGVVPLLIALSLAFPVLGLTLAVIGLLDALVLSRIPPIRRALG